MGSEADSSGRRDTSTSTGRELPACRVARRQYSAAAASPGPNGAVVADRDLPRHDLFQPGRLPSVRYASGPTGWTKQPSTQSCLGPRTSRAGRRARSTSAVAVKAISTTAKAMISRCWVRVRSLHRCIDVMIHINATGTPPGLRRTRALPQRRLQPIAPCRGSTWRIAGVVTAGVRCRGIRGHWPAIPWAGCAARLCARCLARPTGRRCSASRPGSTGRRPPQRCPWSPHPR